METAMSTDKLLNTDSIQELAKFWDTHDVTDFEDSLEEVQETVFDRENVITLKLQHDEAIAVHKLASSKGMDDAELIHQWVLEKIRTH
jgi:predicted DNA binding CopG/RHH family protein